MKIAVISNMYPHSGHLHLGTFVQRSCINLEREGCMVHVIFLKRSCPTWYSYPIFYWHTYRYLIRSDVDIVYVHYVSHSVIPVLLAKLIWLKRLRFKFVLHAHGSDLIPEASERRIRRWFKYQVCRIAARRADLFVVPSLYFEEMARKVLNISSLRTFVSPSGGVSTYGRDVAFCDEAVPRNDVLFASRLISGKGGVIAANTMVAITRSDPKCRGVIVGSGPDEDVLRIFLSNMRVKDRISIIPLLPPAQLFKAMSCARVFLFPSYRGAESLGLVLIEAIMNGAVPVVLDNGAVREIIPPSLHECLIAEDADDFQAKAVEVWRLPRSSLAEIVCMLRSHCAKKYGEKEVAKKLMARFKELLDV